MPIVSEGESNSAPYVQKFYNASGAHVPSYDKTVSVNHRNRFQRGYRSRGEHQAAVKQLHKVQSEIKSWSQQRQLINALDRVERSLRDPMISPGSSGLAVHPRDYTEQRSYGQIQPALTMPSGSKGLPVFTVQTTVDPSKLGAKTEAFVQASAGKMMRQSRPTAPEANLGQWFGELRDANRLFKGGELANFKSTAGTTAATGGAYLNWQFGWKGFLGDLKKSAEAILDSEHLVNDFVLNSSKLIRRRRSEVISQGAAQSDLTLYSNNFTPARNTSYLPIGSNLCTWNPFVGLGSSAGPRARGYVSTSWTEQIRSFATFEYFVMDPQESLNRMPSYYQKARYLLGDSVVSASTLYELAPWSWMADWFVDIGGLLSYQESVATDRLVARQSGSVYEYEVNTHAHLSTFPRSGQTVFPVWSGDTFFEQKFQRRRRGSPYNMGSSWDGFSTSQWFILGALGMTQAPRVPKIG